MPELPEVEVMTQNLRRWMGDGPVRLQVVDSRLLKGTAIWGREPQAVTRIWRRAKYSIIERETDCWILHFRMTGKVVPERPGGKLRAVFHLADRRLHFLDARCLGELTVLPRSEALAYLEAKNLGPEPYPQERSAAWWRERFAGLRGSIKPALMRQDRVAGLGNIAASEICFLAGIDPRERVPEVRRWQALASAAHGFLHRIVELESGDEILYVNDDPGARNPFSVYGRTRCPECGGSIERFTQSGRGTFWCRACQGENRSS